MNKEEMKQRVEKELEREYEDAKAAAIGHPAAVAGFLIIGVALGRLGFPWIF